MKNAILVFMAIICLFFSDFIVKANVNLKIEEVAAMQVIYSSGESRLFRITDGYEEKIMRKVLEWINTSSPGEGKVDLEFQKVPISLKLKMNDGEIAIIEPVYTCISEQQTKICTAVDGEIVYNRNKVKTHLKSPKLYDWLFVGWKHEIDGPTKVELLEETLYTRYYFSHLDKAYSDFFMCPKIDKIERINGDTRSHIVYASALSYYGHHSGNSAKINIILTDTRNGVQIKEIIKHENISGKESNEQCKGY
ncbi:hypothetical protein WAK64_15715 [Bacillus spongiae]|uniref:DUF3888 domain-containing protein n=1 Tax=Bacillus spongiae TaxID=2683610 RepID=A0ABU8HH95_9BACI